MGKKKVTHKKTHAVSEKGSEAPTTEEGTPPNPQQPQSVQPPQMPAMVQLDALEAYLRQQDPNRDLTATLAGFGQVGGAPAVPTPASEIPATGNPTPIPTSPKPSSENTSPIATTHQSIEPLNVSPLSAYQDPGPVEGEEADQEPNERADGDEEKDKATETPVAGMVPQEGREEEDLNETARKQGLMTDEEFQAILDGVVGMEVNADEMAEGLDLASQAGGEGEISGVRKESGSATHQPVGEVEEKEPGQEEQIMEKISGRQFEQEVPQPVDTVEEEKQKPETPQQEAEGCGEEAEREIEARPEEPEITVPEVLKPKGVKRKLVLKKDTKVGGKRPTRVSQRCLGKWTSSKAKANTTEDAVEVSSGSEKTTPTKPGEEPSQTSQEGSPIATRTVPPTSTDQEADRVAEGLDLAPEPADQKEAIDDDTIICVVTKPTTQEDPSPATKEEAEEDEE